MIAILSSVLPVGCIVLIGFLSGKTLELHLPTLSRVALYVFFPALIADSVYRTTLSGQNTANILLGCTLTYFVMGFIAWLLGQKLGFSVPLQKSFVITSSFPNAGNMGLSVSLFALGEAGLERAVVYMITHSILSVITAPAFIKGGGFWPGVRLTLKLPLMWGVVAGLGLRLFEVQLPFKLDQGLHLLAEGTIPVALLVLGLQISSNQFQVTPYESGASLMRLVGGAIAAYLVGRILGLTGVDLQVLVLQSAMPCAINSFLMINEFGGDAPRTARVVVLSTLLGFLTLPVVLWAIGAAA